MIVGSLCDTCGSPFFAKASNEALYCSAKCSGRAASRRWRTRDVDVFWSKVCPEPNTGCWLWTGCTRAGYGQVSFRQEKWLAHRLAWTLTVGPLADGIVLCHRCDTPTCVSPANLFPGTQLDNMRDCSRKGRTGARPLRGERVGNSKLTEAQVVDIRLLGAAKVKQREIAARMGVSQMHVWRVVHGQVWKHVKGAAP